MSTDALAATPSDPPGPGTPTAGRSLPWILTYHSVADHTADPYNITVTPARLARQLRWLRARGLRGCDLTAALRAHALGARDVVALTFDDGYTDFATAAVPVLRRFGCTATVYVLAGRLGGSNEWDPEGPRKALMTADQVREVAGAGMEIGSHGLAHVSLPEREPDELAREVRDSRTVLGELVGRPVRSFAYPFGHVEAREVRAVRDAGYESACAVGPVPGGGPFALPRTHIGQRDASARMWARKLRHDRRGR